MRAWQELVPFLITPRVWDIHNPAAYGDLSEFGERSWGKGLFEWEQEFLREYCNKPPGNILVTAAGGGREALALANLGYTIYALEPSPVLASICRRAVPPERLPEVVEMSHREFTHSRPQSLAGPFEAVIVGWGSLSHLATLDEAAALIRALRGVCPFGPILISYMRKIADTRMRRLCQAPFRILGANRERFDWAYRLRFALFRKFDEDQIAMLAERAGEEVRILLCDNFQGAAVLVRRHGQSNA